MAFGSEVVDAQILFIPTERIVPSVVYIVLLQLVADEAEKLLVAWLLRSRLPSVDLGRLAEVGGIDFLVEFNVRHVLLVLHGCVLLAQVMAGCALLRFEAIANLL